MIKIKTSFERYVIVCLLEGEVLDYHEKITSEVCSLFNVRPQKLPAHFTIKAPFEHDNISEIEALTENFCLNHYSFPLTLNNYGYFRNNVVFMDIQLSKEAQNTHDEYIKNLQKVHWLEWKNNEKKPKVFHCTIVSKLLPDKFTKVWNYVQKYPYTINSSFDNISILKWNGDRWITHKKFLFRK